VGDWGLITVSTRSVQSRLYHSLRFSPCDYSRGVVAKFVFGGKDKAGDGAPEGLPLICRFSYLILPLLKGGMIGS